ncbi:aldehyde dehydrogenase family protein [Membranihabitans marinus]|uniref:aldehyde dehydrogenase family protein n=1 Tax=Membranihabitans marinus TaxID=1227546 RepID=UPI001F2032A9|nr:aldehyde dehydrogenase family protein [Membranihabitans marinus]
MSNQSIKFLKVINPANANIVDEIPMDTASSLASKFTLLESGQAQWRQKSVAERLAIIQRFGEIVKTNLEVLAEILTTETGKPLQQSRNEIRGAQNRIVHLTAYAEKWLATETFDTPSMIETIKYEPLGVIANISAWNFPYNVGYNVFLYALVAGNAVMYKPSEYASLTGLKMAAYLYEAGLPESVFQTAIGDGEVGQALLDMDFNGYFFTGSHKTGQHIAQSLASKLIPVQLELGGKDPLYVMDDIQDIRQAAINAAEGAFYNAGQSCCAVERIYVSSSIYDEFLSHFVEEVKSYKVGNPMSADTFIGPLTRSAQIEVLEAQVKDALDKGGQLECGGKKLPGLGHYFAPTVLSAVNHSMSVMMEESFGPIIGIQAVDSDEEAIGYMKDTVYGLTAAVFSQDKERAIDVLESMNTGTVYWNCCDRVSPNLPWSGRKNSGLGSTLSSQGIRAFVQPKAYQLRLP